MTEKDEPDRRAYTRLLDYRDELDNCKDDLRTWTDSLEELSEIEDAFGADKKDRLHGKTVLDIGTDCVKPLYIALKLEPRKIIGISEDLSVYSFASDLEQKFKLFTETEIHLYNCSLFDDENIKKTLGNEKFDFVLVSKTLHHLRTGKCVLHEREEHKCRDDAKNQEKHKCRDDEKRCIYKFKEEEIFKRLLELGERVIVYEWFDPNEEDPDKVRGRGGYFTVKEWKQMLKSLSEKYRVEFFRPLRCHLDEKGLDEIIAKLRQIDCICFYVEAK
jgi:hypothetical protein